VSAVLSLPLVADSPFEIVLVAVGLRRVRSQAGEKVSRPRWCVCRWSGSRGFEFWWAMAVSHCHRAQS